MNLSFDAAALSLDLPRLRRKHPNRLPFRGVLTLIDVPSDRAPSGSNNRRVLIPRAVAESALPSLIGMALDYTPALDGHDSRRKIGVITAARISTAPADHAHGSQLTVRGYIYARDFPEVVLEVLRATPAPGASPAPLGHAASLIDEGNRVTASAAPAVASQQVSPHSASAMSASGISLGAPCPHAIGPIRAHIPIEPCSRFRQVVAARARPPALGMSYEIAEAQVVNEASPIWVLRDFVFTGAAVLRRDRAAYLNTSIELVSE